MRPADVRSALVASQRLQSQITEKTQQHIRRGHKVHEINKALFPLCCACKRTSLALKVGVCLPVAVL